MMTNNKVSLQCTLISIFLIHSPTFAWVPRITGLGEVGSYETVWVDGLLPLQDIKDQVGFF